MKHTMSNQVLKALSALVLCMYVFILFTKRMASPKRDCSFSSEILEMNEKNAVKHIQSATFRGNMQHKKRELSFLW